MFKKTLLATAVISAGVAGVAHAVPKDADRVTSLPVAVASELTRTLGALAITSAGATDPLDFQQNLGAAISTGTNNLLVTVTASSNVASMNLAAAPLVATTAGAGTLANGAIVSGAGTSTQIITADVATAAWAIGDDLLVDVDDLVTTDTGDVTVTYLVEQLVGGLTFTVSSSTFTLVQQKPALSVVFTANATKPDINVSALSADETNANAMGSAVATVVDYSLTNSALTLADTTTAVVNVDDVAVNFTGSVASTANFALYNVTAGATLNVDGQNLTVDANDSSLAASAANAVVSATAATDTFSFSAAVAAGNTTVIDEAVFSMTLTSTVPAAGFASQTYADATGFALDKNGSTDRTELILTPGGIYNSFVRITNTSVVGGDVFLSMIDDMGNTSGQINLGDVAGVATSTLGGKASTGIINTDDIYNAIVAAEPTFDAAGGKLRLVVDAEIPTGGLDVQTVSVTNSDGNSFSTF